MSKLSLVIPTYTITEDLERMAYNGAFSYRRQVKDLIICEDGGNFSGDLRVLADTYIYNKKNVGFTKNVNRGWRYAQGDFVAIVSSDTYLVSGNLEDLCIPGKVTSPMIENQGISRLAGSFWVAPRSITEKIGVLNENLRTYYSDTDYDERVKDFFQKVPSVVIRHIQAQTVKAAGVEGGEEAAKDRQAYENLPKLRR